MDARILIRIYMMERFLERLSKSKYKNNFVIKGGILVTSMVGITMQSTMDIDANVKNIHFDENELLRIINDIISVDVEDDIEFEVKSVGQIMKNKEYPGVRFEINAKIDKILVPFKIDISTGDVVTPCETEYSYSLLLSDEKISFLAYNLETILAEKLQTILTRNVLNTRMRDYYDVYVLTQLYGSSINESIFREAFEQTVKKRGSSINNVKDIIISIENSKEVAELWERYCEKYTYAACLDFEMVVSSVKALSEKALLS